MLYLEKAGNMEKINIGKIVKAVALKGEVKVHTAAGKNGRYGELESVYINGEEYTIEKVRYQGDMAIMKLKGIDDRNAAEAMKGMEIYVEEEDLPELPEDTFYIKDLIGSAVIDEKTKNQVGTLKGVITNTAQDVYEINVSGNIVMVPAVKEFIKSVDIENKQIVINFIEGML